MSVKKLSELAQAKNNECGCDVCACENQLKFNYFQRR